MPKMKCLQLIGNSQAKATLFLPLNEIPVRDAKLGLSASQDGNQATDAGSNQNPEDYIVRDFRILSEVLAWPDGLPVDFSKPGLLKSVPAMMKDGRTVFQDHWLSAEKWCGLAKNAVYVDKPAPAGVNAQLWIDKIASPKIARGVETGALSRCSVTVSFTYEQSHPEMHWRDWANALNEEVDGEMVRLIVTEIENIWEVSLVWWGADDTAKALESKEPELPQAASLEAPRENIVAGPQRPEAEEEAMKFTKQLAARLREVFGLEDVKENDTLDENRLEALCAAHEKVQSRNAEVESAAASFANVNETLRQEVLNLAKVVEGGEVPTITQSVIEIADYEQLRKFRDELEVKQNKMFPLVCVKCGSANVERRSSVEASLDLEDDPKPGETADQAVPAMKTVHG